MQSPKTIGVIINPKAGKGFADNAEIARLAASRFPDAAIFTGPGETGAAAFYDDPRLVICDCGRETGRQQTMTLASNLASRPVDLLLVIGGDGTLADVAYALVGAAPASAPPTMGTAAVPIVGIGAGSTNVGPLITCRGTEVGRLDTHLLETTLLPAVLAKCQGAWLGIGFNDCILGFTVIGTLDGQVRELDARAKMQGLNLLGQPDLVGTPLTLVERVSPSGTVEVARGEWVSSVAIGFSEPAFFGKAVTGGICLAADLHIPAGCLVTDSPMVRMETTRQEALTLGPCRSQYIGFDETMYIRVSGLRSGTAVCADGNPLKISREDHVVFWVRPNAVQAVKSKQHLSKQAIHASPMVLPARKNRSRNIPRPVLNPEEIPVRAQACGFAPQTSKPMCAAITYSSPASFWVTKWPGSLKRSTRSKDGRPACARPWRPTCPAITATSAPVAITPSAETLMDQSADPGGFAEYVRVPPRLIKYGLAHLPDDLSIIDASLAEPLGCVFHGLEALKSNRGTAC